MREADRENINRTQESGDFLFKELKKLIQRADLCKRLYEEAELALDKYTTKLAGFKP